MILDKVKQDELQEAAKPLIKWLCENCHPHVTAIVTPGAVDLSEGVCRLIIDEYVPD